MMEYDQPSNPVRMEPSAASHVPATVIVDPIDAAPAAAASSTTVTEPTATDEANDQPQSPPIPPPVKKRSHKARFPRPPVQREYVTRTSHRREQEAADAANPVVLHESPTSTSTIALTPSGNRTHVSASSSLHVTPASYAPSADGFEGELDASYDSTTAATASLISPPPRPARATRKKPTRKRKREPIKKQTYEPEDELDVSITAVQNTSTSSSSSSSSSLSLPPPAPHRRAKRHKKQKSQAQSSHASTIDVAVAVVAAAHATLLEQYGSYGSPPLASFIPFSVPNSPIPDPLGYLSHHHSQQVDEDPSSFHLHLPQSSPGDANMSMISGMAHPALVDTSSSTDDSRGSSHEFPYLTPLRPLRPGDSLHSSTSSSGRRLSYPLSTSSPTFAPYQTPTHQPSPMMTPSTAVAAASASSLPSPFQRVFSELEMDKENIHPHPHSSSSATAAAMSPSTSFLHRPPLNQISLDHMAHQANLSTAENWQPRPPVAARSWGIPPELLREAVRRR